MLSPDRAAVAASLVPWARKVAHGAISPTVPAHVRDELVGDALEGLCQAAARATITEGPQFRAFASKRIKGAILDAQRRADPLTRTQRDAVKSGAAAAPQWPRSLDEIAERVDIPETAPAAMTAATRSRLSSAYAAMRDLSYRERAALILTTRDGYTLAEAAHELGVTESGVCRMRARALARLRRSLSV